jgi:peptide/nickel transport system permease protein
MKVSSESPWQQVKKRFKKNGSAMFSWYFILVSFFLAVFAYMIIPDKTPLSNRMNLSLYNQSPGFKATFIKLPKNVSDESNLVTQFFTGKKDSYEYIAINSFYIKDNHVFYREYSEGSDTTGIPEKKIALNQIGISPAQFEEENIITRTFIFGTDRYGRDMFSRIIAGTRVTLSVGLVAVIISLFIGILLGSIAGFFRGWIDDVIVWLINVVWSVPTLLLVIAITLVLGKGFEQVFIAVGMTMWVDVARIVRSQLFSVRELEFVSAGRAMGFRNFRIIAYHMLPNVIGPVLVIAASNFSTAILLEAGLSFLGIGAQPPTPSWGAMIKENYGYIIIPGSAYLAILPGVAIMLMTMAFTFVANGLRDAIDSKTEISIV